MYDLMRILATARRQELLRLCWDEERAAGDLHAALGDVTFGAISQHLQRLTAAGLLTMRKDGRRRLYRAKKDALGPLRRMLESMWTDALWQLKVRAELAAGRRGPRRRSPSPSRSRRKPRR